MIQTICNSLIETSINWNIASSSRCKCGVNNAALHAPPSLKAWIDLAAQHRKRSALFASLTAWTKAGTTIDPAFF